MPKPDSSVALLPFGRSYRGGRKSTQTQVPANRLRRSLRLGGLLFVALFFLYPTVSSAQNVTLAEVVVEGAVTADAKLILSVSGLSAGKVIAREDLQDAVRQIYGLGLFEDVRIEGEDVAGQLKAIIKVKELPTLAKISFKGNDEIKEKDLTLPIKTGQKVGLSLLKDAETAIKKAYQEKGFFLVTIKSSLEPGVAAGEANAVFEIDEQSPVKVEEVVIVGNKDVYADELIKKMSNKPRGFLKSLFGGGKFNREKYAEDLNSITEQYRKKGYIDAVIVDDTIMLNEEKSHVTIQITVNEGPRYYFGSSSFEGMSVIPEERLRKSLEYSPGDVYNQDKFDESEQNIYNAYLEEGYLYVRLIEDTKTQDSIVNITYEVSEGVPAHINRIDIVGNSKTKDKVIRRELALYPGQIFRRSLLERSLRNVMLLNYFANAVPEFNQLPDGRVDLTVRVEEKPTGQIQVGGGYSEQDKFVGTVDLGIPNLFGNGQNANFLVEFGKRRQSYRIGFTEPWLFDTPTSVGFDISHLERTYDDPFISGTEDFTQNSSGLSTRLGRRLKWPDDYFSVYWNYRLEDFKYTDFSDSSLAETYQFSDGLISATSATVSRDSRDLPEFATRGSRSSYRVEFAGGAIGGDWSYTKHNFTYSVYKKIWKGFTFSPTWNFGVIQGGAGRTSVPYSELFYAGGIRSDGMIRGYSDRSIVAFQDTSTVATRPATASGDFIGDLNYSPIDTARGQALYVLNAQLVFPVVAQQIHGLLFFDAGNVWQSATDIDPFDVWTSYGFGFRLQVPGMGLLGFDFGIPLRGDDKGKLKPHFQFGGSF
jgi:outer membrane protein insertion porin family